ncbi:MAG TPA: tetratricopeptide repeat protein [Gemmatimonadaceae bacterium]|jgi:tetratricopeptide (TPR) repeat protein
MSARQARRIVAVTLATLLCDCGRADAQQGSAPSKWADTISAEIEKAQLADDATRLNAAVALAGRVATAYPTDGLILHYQGYALYRRAVSHAANSAGDAATLESAKVVLARSLQSHPLPETHMLIASIDGQLIASDPNRAMELGIDSQSETGAALAIGAKNPRVWLLRGQGAIFTPPEYGGGLDQAEAQLKRAIELFAADAPKLGEPSWGKAEAYAWLGQVYEKKGDKVNAAAMYDKAIEIAPTYAFAKAARAALE